MNAPNSVQAVCFAHIPKCGGTSITSVFRKAWGNQCFSGLTTQDYTRLSDARIKDYRFFAGHSYHRDRRRLPVGTRFFTVLREPTARIVSLKRYWGRLVESELFEDADCVMVEALRIARTCSVEEFLRSRNAFIRQEIRNGLLRQIIPLDVLERDNHLEIVTHFGAEIRKFHSVLTIERMDESFPLMLAEFGLPARELGRENVSSKYDENLAEFRQALYQLSPLDFAAYEIARSIEHEQISARSIRVAKANGVNGEYDYAI